ncbi:site-specific integrase [Nostoc sp. CHAB 5844]|nr:site-specific integrase [Nostoc sp. CHAB 5844]
MFPKKCFNGDFKISREALLSCGWESAIDRSDVIKGAGVYTIFSSEDGECLYVGQSMRVMSRLASSGTWDKAKVEYKQPILYVFKTQKSELRYLECLAIGVLRPKWNFIGYVQSEKSVSGRVAPDFISEADFLQILEQENCIRNRVVLTLGYYAGLSASEICRIQWQNIDFENGVITVSGRRDVARTIEIDGSVLIPLLVLSIKQRNLGQRQEKGYLLLASNNKPLHRSSAHYIVKLAAEKAGIMQSVSLKTFRNSHGMNLLKQGKSISEIQKRLGVIKFKALAYESLPSTAFWT